MRETQFISQNQENWREFEEELRKKEKDPDKLSRLFTEITDDLSYSRSFYSNRSVRYYLNSLAQRLYLDIYKNKKRNRSAFLNFWIEELPAIIYHSRFDFLISFLLFLVSVAIGVFCAMEDPNFVNTILGEQYVEMTLENIDKGDPLAVYKDSEELGMSLRITLNNLIVAFRTFVLGVLLGLGTIASMLYNGIMIGCFHYFLIEHGVVKEAFLTVWQHGTLEISAIIIAGAAGIVIGRGWFFPGTYSRIQSFKYSAVRGMKIFIGIAPIIILAGFIEGFITRHTEFPDIVRIMVIVVSLIIILGYYVIIPFLTPDEAKRKYEFEGVDNNFENFKFQPQKVLTTGEIFTSTFQVFKKVVQALLKPLIISSIIYGVIIFFFGSYIGIDLNDLSSQINSSKFAGQLPTMFLTGIVNLALSLGNFFNYHSQSLLIVLNTIILSFTSFLTLRQLRRYFVREQIRKEDNKASAIKEYSFHLITIAAFNAIFFSPIGIIIPLVILLLPIILLTASVISLENENPIRSLSLSFSYAKGLTSRFVGIYISLILFGAFSFFLVSSPFTYVIMEFFNWNLSFEAELKQELFKTSIVITSILGLNLTFSFLLTGFTSLFFTLKEVHSANGIKSSINKIGSKSTIYGMARENS